MVRTINREQAEKEIRMFELSELNLKTFPVEYKKEHFDKLFNYFTETFEKM